MSIDAMKQALTALERGETKLRYEAITALRAAIEEAENPWQGLTEEEIEQMMDYWSEDARSAYGGAHSANGEYVYIPDIIRDVEKRLKEKNDG